MIIIGRNKNWKVKKRNMRNFVQIPFYKLVQMIEYKAEEKNIKVVKIHERYTSGCSIIDKELPLKRYYNKARRMTRGMYKSNTGRYIHADINAAYNMIMKYIMKKMLKNKKYISLIKRRMYKNTFANMNWNKANNFIVI